MHAAWCCLALSLLLFTVAQTRCAALFCTCLDFCAASALFWSLSCGCDGAKSVFDSLLHAMSGRYAACLTGFFGAVSIVNTVDVMQFPSQSLQEAGIHGHFFVNGGTLSLLSGTGRSIQQAVTDDFMRSWRWTAVCCTPCYLQSLCCTLPTLSYTCQSCMSLLACCAVLGTLYVSVVVDRHASVMGKQGESVSIYMMYLCDSMHKPCISIKWL